MRTPLLLTALLLATPLFGGCDPFATAQSADTIEAYEHFLENNDGSPWEFQARSRLEQLYLEQARAEPSLAAYDEWIARYPASSYREAVVEERETYLFEWAQQEGTIEAWERFIREYGSSSRRGEAQLEIRLIQHAPSVTFDNPRVSRVNLAEDPEGPLNGWKLEVDVTNAGEVSLTKVVVGVTVAGTELSTAWPVAATDWHMPVTEAERRPLGAGTTRTWAYTTRIPPETWDGSFATTVTDIRAAD